METGKLLLYVMLVYLMSRRWRLHRRMFHQAFRQAEIPTYHALTLRSAHKMLFSLLQDPDNYTSHVKMSVCNRLSGPLLKLIFIRFTASSILSIVYDYEVKAKDDTILHVIERYLEVIVEMLTPGNTVAIETFPFRMFTHSMMACGYISTEILVLRLPSWLPGATFKRASVKCLNAAHDVKELPFQYVKEKMVRRLIHVGAVN